MWASGQDPGAGVEPLGVGPAAGIHMRGQQQSPRRQGRLPGGTPGWQRSLWVQGQQLSRIQGQVGPGAVSGSPWAAVGLAAGWQGRGDSSWDLGQQGRRTSSGMLGAKPATALLPVPMNVCHKLCLTYPSFYLFQNLQQSLYLEREYHKYYVSYGEW